MSIIVITYYFQTVFVSLTPAAKKKFSVKFLPGESLKGIKCFSIVNNMSTKLQQLRAGVIIRVIFHKGGWRHVTLAM